MDAQPDLCPKWRPRYVRIAAALPTTPTNKVLVRTLVHQKFRSDRMGGDTVFVRGRGEDAYRCFGGRSRGRARAGLRPTAAGPRPGTS